jgi:hypothetical protein
MTAAMEPSKHPIENGNNANEICSVQILAGDLNLNFNQDLEFNQSMNESRIEPTLFLMKTLSG